jgi:hypothetical protein
VLQNENRIADEPKRVFWERTGVLGPVYRLLGQELSDVEIASKLNVTELNVRGCIAWLLRALRLTNRGELFQYASIPAARSLTQTGNAVSCPPELNRSILLAGVAGR